MNKIHRPQWIITEGVYRGTTVLLYFIPSSADRMLFTLCAGGMQTYR